MIVAAADSNPVLTEVKAGAHAPLNVMILGTGDSAVDRMVVESALNEVSSRTTLDSVCFKSPTEYANDASDNRTNLYVFLLDRNTLGATPMSRAEVEAMRRAVKGEALIIPVLTDGAADFEQSRLAFLSPLVASEYGVGVRLGEEATSEFVSRALEFANSLDPVRTSAQKMVERVSRVTQIAEAVDPLPCHMSSYDDFVEQLIARLQVMRMNDRRRNLNHFAEALKQVFNAQMVYCYYRGKNDQLHIYEADTNQSLHDCSAALVHSVLEEAVNGYADRACNRSLRLQNFLPQLSPASGSPYECMVVVNDRLPNCGVFIAKRGGFERFPVTEVLSTVVNTLHDALAWANFESFDRLKALVYDQLKATYRFVSTDMYEDRRRIFKSQLSGINVHFEPMFRFDPQSKDVDIFAYEALAREHFDSSAAPVEIFNSASLWGMGFQLEVDSTMLNTTIAAYSAQLKHGSADARAIKPLSLNVYPATLRSPAYRELLYEVLGKSAPLSGHHLIMEVSEKTVVSPELQIEARQQLEEYRDVVRKLGHLTGVRFAIDDFGVGNASLSRLDSLKPHYVKIDRDILSFDTRMADTLIRYLVQSQRELGTSVILEGVDIHSKLTLNELVSNIGVGLIQGHSLSKAVSGFDEAWETQVCERIKSGLGWNSTPLDPVDGAVIH
jgi:EAL domain-containing protein (putative c-di-GMP-specific phosphodiesterase class I)